MFCKIIKLLDHLQKCLSYLFFSAVSWNDTSCSFKAVLLTGPIVRFLAMEDLLTSSLASHVLLAVLQGLQIHGQHDANQVRQIYIKMRIRCSSYILFQATLITLGVQVYEILRPKFPRIVEIMQQIPNTNLADIQKLDEKILVGAQSKGKIDKYKKDLFKKITAQVSFLWFLSTIK